VVSQRDLLPVIRDCLQGLPDNDRSRVWNGLVERIGSSTIDQDFEEHNRNRVISHLASSAIASLRAAMPSTWPARRPYEAIESHLRSFTIAD
jgi:hypothetical protein